MSLDLMRKNDLNRHKKKKRFLEEILVMTDISSRSEKRNRVIIFALFGKICYKDFVSVKCLSCLLYNTTSKGPCLSSSWVEWQLPLKKNPSLPPYIWKDKYEIGPHIGQPWVWQTSVWVIQWAHCHYFP